MKERRGNGRASRVRDELAADGVLVLKVLDPALQDACGRGTRGQRPVGLEAQHNRARTFHVLAEMGRRRREKGSAFEPKYAPPVSYRNLAADHLQAQTHISEGVKSESVSIG